MAEKPQYFMDRLIGTRDAVRTSAAHVRRIAQDAPAQGLAGPHADAARSLAAAIKAHGQDIVAAAEQLERKL